MKEIPPIDILPFHPSQTAKVIDLIVSIQRGEFSIPITAQDQPDLADIPGFYQKGCGNFWVAAQEGRAVGTISLLDIGNNQAALRKMFVHKDFRGRETGTAGKLLKTLLAWAGNEQVSDIYLGTTPKFLAAHRFYEKNGFAEIEKSDLPPAFPVMVVDTKFYRYTV